MTTLVLQGTIEITLPSVLDLTEIKIDEFFARKPRIKMATQIEMKEVAIVEPSGRRVVLPHLVLTGIIGSIIPVIEDDRVVIFRVEQEADKPLVIEDKKCP